MPSHGFIPPKRAAFTQAQPLRKPPALAADFPKSEAQPSSIFTFTGVTPQSTETLRRILTENDHGYDMWEAERRYAHNHFSHSALTRYALGAPPALLQAGWEYDRGYLAALDPHEDGRKRDTDVLEKLPPKITRENWKDPSIFGKKPAHSLYLPFFHAEVARLGIDGAVSEYILSPVANKGEFSMLGALVAGVLHPIIHLGLGLEFNDPLIVAEALAQTCQHDPSISGDLYPGSLAEVGLKSTSGKPSNSLLGLYVEFVEDHRLDPGPYDPEILINDRLKQAAKPDRVPLWHDLVARWDLSDLSDAGTDAKLEEVAWLAALLAGATTRPGYKTRIDFFLMHLLTSSLFLPSYMRRVKKENERRAIFQTYALALLHTCVVRGRPRIFPSVAMGYPEHASGPLPRAGKGASEHKLSMIGDGSHEQDNAWLEIVENAMVTYDSHVPKSIRSLLHYSQLYGHRPAGEVPGGIVNGEEVVEGISKVDGTVFVRLAGEFMRYAGWVKETTGGGDGNDNGWDRSALGWDGAWDDETPEN